MSERRLLVEVTRPVATPTPLGIAPESRARFCNNQCVKQQQLATAVHTHTGESVHNTAPSNASTCRSWSRTQKSTAAIGGCGFGDFTEGKPADQAKHKACFPCHEPAKAKVGRDALNSVVGVRVELPRSESADGREPIQGIRQLRRNAGYIAQGHNPTVFGSSRKIPPVR